MDKMSNSRIDRLGEKLKQDQFGADELTLLDNYRKTFNKAYQTVVNSIKELKLDLAGRPAKSTKSIIDKLNRESIRLSQIQDIAGCRIITRDIKGQNRTITEIKEIFPNAKVIDRRIVPSNDYRAVHLIVVIDEKLIEVQVRTALQHYWAEVSEKFSDEIDISIKYGGGSGEVKELLSITSNLVKNYEEFELIFNSENKELITRMKSVKNEITDIFKKYLNKGKNKWFS